MPRRARVKGNEGLRCRAYGHPWIDYGWLPMIQEGLRMWSQDFECGRCKAKRHDRRAFRTFALLRRRYELPSGYPSRLTRAEALTALVEGQEEGGTIKSIQGEAVLGA